MYLCNIVRGRYNLTFAPLSKRCDFFCLIDTIQPFQQMPVGIEYDIGIDTFYIYLRGSD